MNKYEIRTQKKKDAIIQASLNLFKEKGYTRTSINEIAAAANVSAVSIYNYFGSKESLVKECAALLLQEANNMTIALLSKNIGFNEKLRQAVFLCTEKPYELLNKYFLKEALEDKIFVKLFQDGVNRIRLQVLQAFIECGKEEGAIDKNISTESIMQFLSVATEVQKGWTTQSQHQEKAGELYHLILYGLIGR